MIGTKNDEIKKKTIMEIEKECDGIKIKKIGPNHKIIGT